MRKRLRVLMVVAVTLGSLGLGTASAAADGVSLTVTPKTGLEDGQTVTVSGSGWGDFPDLVVRECALFGRLAQEECYHAVPVRTASDGTFSTPYTVVNPGCGVEWGSCVVSLYTNDGDLLLPVFIEFARHASDPDVVIKRRSDGRLFFDNTFGSGTSVYQHPISPGGYWTFAVLVQNDGDRAGDLFVTADPVSSPFSIKYFWGYSDVTAQVTGNGLRLTNMAPGAQITLAVAFGAAPTAPVGAKSSVNLVATSLVQPAKSDYVQVGVIAAAP